jgi:murein L,D-transpeptidase YafK
MAGLALALAFSVYAEAREASRVRQARESKEAGLRARFDKAGVEYPARRLLVRVFKLGAELEVWAQGKGRDDYVLISAYPVCYVPGRLGPKRREGDNQVPEGVYRITIFNPASNFHLSLGLDYPNRSDRILSDRQHPGGDIFIHGDCASIGCVPILDDPIEELYLMALDSRDTYRADPQVHLFPCRMDTEKCQEALAPLAAADPELKAFWDNLRPVYDYFEKDPKVPQVRVDGKGRYVVE